MTAYQSWGRIPKASQSVTPVYWRQEVPDLNKIAASVLAYGKGRSYGDVCLNDGGALLDLSRLDHFLDFDPQTGLLKAEAGVTFAKILETYVPQGWFLPVTPGTQYVTVAGALANDVHGKNHHRAGTFGCHVEAFELLRSSGEKLICSKTENPELFSATIGGLGLTGLILWVSFRLVKIPGPFIEMESIQFENLDEFCALAENDKDYEYSVAWVDCFSQGNSLGRGRLMRGNFASGVQGKEPVSKSLGVPFELPGFLLNEFTIKTFNQLYYGLQKEKTVRKQIHYQPFFYPLDSIQNWNRLYGRGGFYQHQCVIPQEKSLRVMKDLFTRIAVSGQASFLAVLKAFGDRKSPGMMSFPKPGLTLALDFPNKGEKTLRLLDELDKMTADAGGAVNPSKDARMSGERFKTFFPQWKKFSEYIDPKFSSSFWRRVTQ